MVFHKEIQVVVEAQVVGMGIQDSMQVMVKCEVQGPSQQVPAVS